MAGSRGVSFCTHEKVLEVLVPLTSKESMVLPRFLVVRKAAMLAV